MVRRPSDSDNSDENFDKFRHFAAGSSGAGERLADLDWGNASEPSGQSHKSPDTALNFVNERVPQMNTIIRWVVVLGLIWFIALMGITIAQFYVPPDIHSPLPIILGQLQNWGEKLGNFIAPVLQLALILLILITTAERFGLSTERKWPTLASLSAGNNIQAFIAVAIVGAVVVGALANVQRIDILKDLALVVVGFYFGTRRSLTEIEDAVVFGGSTTRNASDVTKPSQSPVPPDQSATQN